MEHSLNEQEKIAMNKAFCAASGYLLKEFY